MIRFLATIFRAVSWAIGATPPPPGGNEAGFVFTWIGVIAAMFAFCAVVLYLVIHLVR